MERTYSIIECALFVAGEPLPVVELARILDLSADETRTLLKAMERDYRAEGRGLLPLVTDESAQLISNADYVSYVEELFVPDQSRPVSQSILETLATVAYRQPVTRAEIESVRGVRCEYAVAQLQKMNLITPVGRKDTVGKPILYGTTDNFLRKFGIHNLDELPLVSVESGELRVE
ncbi:MAG: SMC-Scp complex subunit ScpB [Clostridiales bacterium]|nr:SMC-Scp complex subunit ScpB [Clostridiales bacterium]